MKTFARAAVLGLSVALAACASSTTVEDPFRGMEGSDPYASRIQLDAINDYDEDVVLYVLSSWGPHRLGEVGPRHRSTFSIPWKNASELRVRVEVLAGPRYTTNALSVAPGHRLEVVIPRNVRRAVVRRR